MKGLYFTLDKDGNSETKCPFGETIELNGNKNPRFVGSWACQLCENFEAFSKAREKYVFCVIDEKS